MSDKQATNMASAPAFQGLIGPFSPGHSPLSLDPAPLHCAICGQSCQRLLVVEGEAIGRAGRRYQVIRCLNCIFWGNYFTYFAGDEPTQIRFQKGENHHFMAEMGVAAPVRAGLGWMPVDDAGLTAADTFAGSTPRWEQFATWPDCPICGHPMAFVLQISGETLDEGYRQLGDDFYMQIEYGATLYFFFCEACNVSCSITQNS